MGNPEIEYLAEVHRRMKKKKTNSLLTPSEYFTIVERFNTLRENPDVAKIKSDDSIMKRYDLREVKEEEDDEEVKQMLFKKGTNLKIMTSDKLYYTLMDLHIETGHKGRDFLRRAVADKYANITSECMQLFLDMCQVCRSGKHTSLSEVRSGTVLEKVRQYRGYFTFLDKHCEPIKDYKFILVYQDFATRFVMIRPLAQISTLEVAKRLIEHFTDKGSPIVLESNVEESFLSRVTDHLFKMWPQCNVLTGRTRSGLILDAMEDTVSEIHRYMYSWMKMKTNFSENWVDGLKYIQWEMNSSFNHSIGCSPCEAAFELKPSMGSACLNLPAKVAARVLNEDQLETYLRLRTMPKGDGRKVSVNVPKFICPKCFLTYESSSHNPETCLTCRINEGAEMADSSKRALEPLDARSMELFDKKSRTSKNGTNKENKIRTVSGLFFTI